MYRKNQPIKIKSSKEFLIVIGSFLLYLRFMVTVTEGVCHGF